MPHASNTSGYKYNKDQNNTNFLPINTYVNLIFFYFHASKKDGIITPFKILTLQKKYLRFDPSQPIPTFLFMISTISYNSSPSISIFFHLVFLTWSIYYLSISYQALLTSYFLLSIFLHFPLSSSEPVPTLSFT